MSSLKDWENKYRKHWPHHYRDVMDKIISPLGMVVVNDTETNRYLPCERPMVRFERSFKQPTTYRIIVQNPLDGNTLEDKQFMEDQLDDAVRFFVEIIGGWRSDN